MNQTPREDAPVGLREQQRLFTRQRLVEAGLQIFARDGYAGARIGDIAAAAGASRATFYLHFSSKLDVIREVIAPVGGRFVELYSELDKPTAPTRDELRAWMRRAVEAYRVDQLRIRAINQAVAIEPDAAHLFLSGGPIESMTSYLGTWTGLDEAKARVRATLLVLQLERFAFFWIIREGDYDEAEGIEALTDAWTSMIAASGGNP